MFTDSEFLSILAAAIGVGALTAWWLTAGLRQSLCKLDYSPGFVQFWTSVAQLCAVLVPVVCAFHVQSSDIQNRRPTFPGAIVGAIGVGALLVVFGAVVVVGVAKFAAEQSKAQPSSPGRSDLAKLTSMLRDVRATQITKSSALAESAEDVDDKEIPQRL